MTEKRDEDEDVGILLIDEESRSDEICSFVEDAEWWQHLDEEERGKRIHYVPASDLESVTRERDAAVRRAGELEGLLRRAAKYFHEDKATTTGTTRLARLVTEAESLLTPKDPSDA